MNSYDAILMVGFGGPEKPEDVLPFLENVTRGRGVPRERLMEVAEHYHHFDGRSPINDQVKALVKELRARVTLPVYWGNRNWHPLLPDTVRKMKEDGVRRAVALATSAFSSYSGCRQYRENIAAAREAVGEGAPAIDKIPPYWNHPGFLDAMADRVRVALAAVPTGGAAELIFTAHSIPSSMASSSQYEAQLREASRLIAARVGHSERWSLVWQSRSGPPSVPWLEPDICDYLRARPDRSPVVIAPVGFLSDHIEVLWDLDNEARGVCGELGIPMARAATVGTHPKFMAALAELVSTPFTACAEGCCPAPPRRPAVQGSDRT
jgi:protoporphyrin/coproporphyrin ferrochelatase